MNRNEMAGILGCSPPTLVRYVAAGCPVIDPGSAGRAAKFNELDVRTWVAERKQAKSVPSRDDGKRRLSLAAAELKEFQLAEKRGSLVSVTEVEAEWTDRCAALRSRMMIIPGRISAQLVTMSDQAAIEMMVTDEIRGALSELSGGG